MLAALFSKRNLAVATLLAAVYFLISIYLMNVSLVWQTMTGAFPLDYKWNILLSLLEGSFTTMDGTTLTVLLAIAALTGLDIVLITQRLKILKSPGKLHWVIGGSSLFGLVTGGCAVCGFPVLALLGLSGSVASLPLHGTEISLISLALLTVSFYLLLRSYQEELNCRVG